MSGSDRVRPNGVDGRVCEEMERTEKEHGIEDDMAMSEDGIEPIEESSAMRR